MAGSDLLVLLLKHTLTVVLVILALRALRDASAARRVFTARCALFALLLAPVLWLLVPVLPVRLPYAWTALLEPPVALPPLAWLASVPARAEAFAAPAAAVSAGQALLFAYAAGVLLYALRTVLGLVRLARIGTRAVEAPEWQASLTRLRAGMGVQRPVRLLVSDQIASPLSWGWRKPVIVLDPHSLAQADPDAVIAHELAHIAHHDWPAMLLARALVALYWWHPLMHLLFRRFQHDAECAADDAVLASGVAPSRYAQTLVDVSRRAFGPVANPQAGTLASQIAARGAQLIGRIGALLAPHRSRAAVTKAQWLFGMAATATLTLVLGGLVQRGEHIVWPDRLLDARSSHAGDSAEALLEALGNPNFTQLAAAMRAENFAQRHAGGHESFRQRAAIPALILALQDRRPVVRQLAAWGLSEMRFPETAPALAALLADPVPAVRAEAAGALGDMGEARWLPALLAMLSDRDPGVRARVAHALGDLADPASVPALQAALTDTDPRVAAKARWALDEH